MIVKQTTIAFRRTARDTRELCIRKNEGPGRFNTVIQMRPYPIFVNERSWLTTLKLNTVSVIFLHLCSII
jgi:hypothetical protein